MITVSPVDQIPNNPRPSPPNRLWAQQTRERMAKVSWGGKRLARELAQDVIREPGRVELREEDGEGLSDGQGEALL